MKYLWSIVERTVVRAISAIASMLLAYFTTPEVLGAYSAAITVLTLLQVATDLSWRQAGTTYPVAYDPRRPVRQISLSAGSICSIVLAAWLIAVLLFADHKSIELYAPLLPLALVPIITALGAPYAVDLQRCGRFRAIAQAQLIAAAVSFVIAIPVLLTYHSAFALTLQFVLAEITLTLLISRAAGQQRIESSLEPTTSSFAKRAIPISLVNMLAWGQSQLDRLSVAVLSGPAILGNYVFAITLSRVVPDVLNVAVANVLRPRLAQDQLASNQTASLNSVAVLVGSITSIQVAGVAVTIPIMERALSPSWAPAIGVLPLLAASAIPAGIATITTTILQAHGKTRSAIAPLTIGSALSIPVGLAATISLTLAATLLITRDTILASWRCWTVRNYVTIRFYLVYLLATASGLLGCIVLIMDGNSGTSIGIAAAIQILPAAILLRTLVRRKAELP